MEHNKYIFVPGAVLCSIKCFLLHCRKKKSPWATVFFYMRMKWSMLY